MKDSLPLHFVGPSFDSQPKTIDESERNKLITAFMQYKATTIRDEGKINPYATFLQRNLIYVQMNELVKRETIVKFMNRFDEYPSFWIRQKKKSTLEKPPLHELIDILPIKNAFNVVMQQITGIARNFSISEQADFAWKIKKNKRVFAKDYEPTKDILIQRLPVEKRDVPVASTKRKIPLPPSIVKKETLFPSKIQYESCVVLGLGENSTHKPIHKNNKYMQSDDKVLCCIICDKKFATLFHLLFHYNMSYPKLQFIPLFRHFGHPTVKIVYNQSYDDIDEVTNRKYVGSMTVYFVFPGDRRRNNRTIPMDPKSSFENFSTFNFVFDDDVYKSVVGDPANRQIIKNLPILHVDKLPRVKLLIKLNEKELYACIDLSYICDCFLRTWRNIKMRLGDHGFEGMGFRRFPGNVVVLYCELVSKFGKNVADLVLEMVFGITSGSEKFDKAQLLCLQKDLNFHITFPDQGSTTQEENTPKSSMEFKIFEQSRRKCRNYSDGCCYQQFRRLAELDMTQIGRLIVDKKLPENVSVGSNLELFSHSDYIYILLEERMNGFNKIKIFAPTDITKTPEYPDEEQEYLYRIDSPLEISEWTPK